MFPSPKHAITAPSSHTHRQNSPLTMEDTDGLPWSSPAFRLRWDVFLSFRGEDTRDNFTHRLYAELERKDVRVFRDNDGLQRGDSLDPTLFEAIEDSAAAIVVISPNYGSSRWCLEEITKICECRRLILPVFYRVDPSDVRRQKGPFEHHFRVHESKPGYEEKVKKWREAMAKVGGISGWVYQEGEELQLIRSLVRRILNELSNTPLVVTPYAVGLDSRVEEVINLLNIKCEGIHVLGIHGMGGIGKTTLAKAVYNKLVGYFKHRCFISSVRETSGKNTGLVSLQNKLIGDLVPGNMSTVDDEHAGKIMIKRTLYEKKVLLVLDDIDSLSQLNALAGKREWFCDGSRIIITTRNKEVLPPYFVNEIYEMQILDSFYSLKLFSYHAFRREKPTASFLKLSEKIVERTGGLPLALEIFGSFLFHKRSLEEWKVALTIHPRNLQDVLKISFDGLDETEKCVFLDIACFFANLHTKKDYVIDIMNGCGFRGETAINVLIERSLVKVTEDGTLYMHDEIKDMGRQIVMHENLVDPGMRSRLWNHDEILRVLEHNKGTRNVQGITITSEADTPRENTTTVVHFQGITLGYILSIMDSAVTYLKQVYRRYFRVRRPQYEKGQLVLWAEQFKSMVNLRLLQLTNVKLEGKFKSLPGELKWIQWKKFPFKHLPYDCYRELTVLDLSGSRIEKVWDSNWWYNNKVAEKLVVLNLDGCTNLTDIPDLTGNPALEKLILENCKTLSRLHKSIGDLHLLRFLNLRGCDGLLEFPSDVSGLKHLENLILSGCSKIKELPKDLGNMNSLRELLVDETAIESLPVSIFRLTKLETLSLKDCRALRELPDCIGKLDSLRELYLDGSALVKLPNSIGLMANLEKISLIYCKSLALIPDSVGDIKLLENLLLDSSSVERLPDSIGSLSYLKNLSIGGCKQISTLPKSVEGLASMIELNLDGTSILDLPNEIGALKSLKKLQMRNCSSLRSLPEAIGGLLALRTLIIVNAAIVELPEAIGMLENLIMLQLDHCMLLRRLPPSIGGLKSLCTLLMEETAVTELPESFGMLSKLIRLKIAKRPCLEVSQETEDIKVNVSFEERQQKLFVLPSSFSNLSLLQEFNARACKITGNISDDFEKLSSLKILNFSRNDFCSLPSSLMGLSVLRELRLSHCKRLKIIPPLPLSLVVLNADDCTTLEWVSDLSKLENLQELGFTNCTKLMNISGLECLSSLRRLFIGGCHLCSASARRKLDKAALKNLRELSMPGSNIPDWFMQGVVRFSKRKNFLLKAVVIGVVASVNQQIVDDLRDELPVLFGIQAQLLRSDQWFYKTVLRVGGVPKTSESQFYLCRYHEFTQLLLLLQDGDEIKVGLREPVIVHGIEIKQWGIHFVYENEDDYVGDESWLHESQQSASERLTRFMGTEETAIGNRDVERNIKHG